MTKRVRSKVDLSAFESIVEFETEEVAGDSDNEGESGAHGDIDDKPKKIEYTIVQVRDSRSHAHTRRERERERARRARHTHAHTRTHTQRLLTLPLLSI